MSGSASASWSSWTDSWCSTPFGSSPAPLRALSGSLNLPRLLTDPAPSWLSVSQLSLSSALPLPSLASIRVSARREKIFVGAGTYCHCSACLLAFDLVLIPVSVSSLCPFTCTFHLLRIQQDASSLQKPSISTQGTPLITLSLHCFWAHGGRSPGFNLYVIKGWMARC